jgi:hypothetical protein
MIYSNAAISPHIIDVEMLRYGLHQNPGDLRTRLQGAVDASDNQGYDAILMAYGLCGKSTHGLAARSTPLVIPRAHDCITLFLGSRQRYQEEFTMHPGTYYYVQDYIERSDGSNTSLSIGAETTADLDVTYASYVEKYGKDNADYLMEVMGAWRSHYNRAGLIDLGVGDATQAEQKARQDAERRGWSFERITGDLTLIRRLLFGEWEDDFLVVPAGQSVAMTYDDGVIGCAIG